MIEKLVIFVLGTLAAGVVALFLAPVIARRAARLAAERVRATAPLSLAEIQAQKDLLRAELAVSVRKAEIRLENAERVASKARIALGEREDALNAATAELAERRSEIETLTGEIESLRSGNQNLEKEVAALRSKYADAAGLTEVVAQRSSELEDARMVIDSQKIELVALRTQSENLRADIAELTVGAEDRGAEIDALRTELAAKSLQSDDRGARIDELTDALHALQQQLAERDQRLARRRRLGTARRRQIEGLREEIAAARSELASRSLSLEAALAKVDDRTETIARLEEERSSLAAKISDLEAQLERRQRQLDVLRDEIEEQRLAQHVEALSPQSLQLRESIGELAARIVNRTAASGDDEIRKLIDAVSSDGSTARRNGNGTLPLAERIKQADLQPGE